MRTLADADHPLIRLRRAVDEGLRQTRGRPRTGLCHDDANDVEGTWGTDDAIDFDPFPLLRAFHAYDANVVVIGQVAGILHGSLELTGDLDLLWDGHRRHAAALAEAFGSVRARLTDDEHRPQPCDESALLLPKVLFRSDTASGDCCTPALPWGQLCIDGIIERAVVAARADLKVAYVALPDLIAMRHTTTRSKDRRRALELESLRAN